MKKWMVLICFFSAMLCCLNIHAESEEQNMIWSVQWNGMLYTGSYSGAIKYGRPNGKGQYQGKVAEKYGIESEIIFSGKWKDGKMEGKGELTEFPSGISYQGKFLEGKLNGRIKKTILKDGKESGYSSVKYTKDVPYGISSQYDLKGNETGYDYMFYGMSVHKICKRAKTYDYRILSYQADEYKNKEIKLECRVLDVYDEIEQKKDKKQKEEDEIIKNRILEVEDDRGNRYILSYKLGKRKYDTVYMPIFEKEDNIVVYGFSNGIATVKDIRLPSIKAIYGRFQDKKEPDVQDLKFRYSEYQNYPYVYENRKIRLQGTIAGVYETKEKWIYVFVDSDSYSDGKKERYICQIENDADVLKTIPDVGKSIVLTGKLQNLKECGERDGKSIYYPLVKLSSITD